jgi:hypothetical protein
MNYVVHYVNNNSEIRKHVTVWCSKVKGKAVPLHAIEALGGREI